ncbi:unnamed protein product, partial [Polarella glacialis]
ARQAALETTVLRAAEPSMKVQQLPTQKLDPIFGALSLSSATPAEWALQERDQHYHQDVDQEEDGEDGECRPGRQMARKLRPFAVISPSKSESRAGDDDGPGAGMLGWATSRYSSGAASFPSSRSSRSFPSPNNYNNNNGLVARTLAEAVVQTAEAELDSVSVSLPCPPPAPTRPAPRPSEMEAEIEQQEERQQHQQQQQQQIDRHSAPSAEAGLTCRVSTGQDLVVFRYTLLLFVLLIIVLGNILNCFWAAVSTCKRK